MTLSMHRRKSCLGGTWWGYASYCCAYLLGYLHSSWVIRLSREWFAAHPRDYPPSPLTR